MSIIGTVVNGQIQLPPDTKLPEGARVEVSVKLDPNDFPEWSRGLIKLIKKRDWPNDMSTNHDHYIHGAPER